MTNGHSAHVATLHPAAPTDPRVAMVLEVLGGAADAEVAARWGTEAELVRRWVRGFIAGGTAVVTNRPQQRAAEERDRFLTAFAHELRTPLTAARGWVELLGAGDIPPELLTQGLAALQVAIDRLVERLADVEMLAAASLGRLTLCPELTSLAELVSPAPPGLEMRLGADATHVVVDTLMFRLVFRDLWLAALLPPAPRVLRLESSLDGPWVEIRVVREAGPINHALLTALFEPFGDENLNCDGTGITLGLYLARALSVAHGGAIGLEQDDDRLVFWVRVPRNPAVQHITTPQARNPLAATTGE